MKNCSFVKLGPCNQDTFTQQKGLTAVDEDKKIILSLRTKVPVENIRTICHHHEHLLDIKFSLLVKKCADPFQQHKQARTKSLRIITMDFYSKFAYHQDKAVPGEKLCPSCHIQVANYASSAESTEQCSQSTENCELMEDAVAGPSNVAGCSNVAEPPAMSSVSSSSINTTNSKNTTAESSDPDVSLQDINAALAVLGETPVKKSKILFAKLDLFMVYTCRFNC